MKHVSAGQCYLKEKKEIVVSICYKQHSAELQVSWPSAEELFLLMGASSTPKPRGGAADRVKITLQSEWWVLGLSVPAAQLKVCV